MNVEYLRYVALRPFTWQGTAVAPGDLLPGPIDPHVLRSLLHTGMVDKTLPDSEASKLAGTLLRARRTQKALANSTETDEEA